MGERGKGDGGGSGGGGGPWSPPGDRRTEQIGVPTQYTLPLRQMWGMGLCLDGAIAVGWLLVGLVASAGSWEAVGAWFGRGAWRWPVGMMVVAWLGPLGLLIWRFAAEIVDPSYPTPRQPRPEGQREGPRWPWVREAVVGEEAELGLGGPGRDWNVRVEFREEKGRRIYTHFKIPDGYEWAWYEFCRALCRPKLVRANFSMRGAKASGVPWEVFEPIQKRFLLDGYAGQQESRNGSGAVVLNGKGRAVVKAFVKCPPPRG